MARRGAVIPIAVLRTAASWAYIAGWFEIFMHGLVPGITYEYDIRSAYPYIIATLPCLLHGRWRRQESPNPPALRHGQIRLVRTVPGGVRGSNPYIGAMLHRRRDGSIVRPHRTGGWYWAHELAAAQRAGLVDHVEIHESWTYSPCRCPPPFREITSLYQRRQEVGSKTPEGKAIKLPMNSVYGKLAQSVGTRPFANVIYAGLITAGTRTMILDSIASHPKGAEAVAMVATDAVFFTEPHPHLPLSGDLGDWELVERSNLCILKPGVYWDDDAREKIRNRSTPLFKARGINAGVFAPQLERLDDEFACMRDSVARGDAYPWPQVSYRTDFAMTSLKQALQRHQWHNAGKVSSAEVVQSADPRTKRDGIYFDAGLGVIRTHPYAEVVGELESHPYLRMEERRELAELLWDAEGRIGKERIRMEREDFDTPDGPAGALFYGQLGTGQWA